MPINICFQFSLLLLFIIFADTSAEKCPTPSWLRDRVSVVRSNGTTIRDKLASKPDVLDAIQIAINSYEKLFLRLGEKDEKTGTTRHCDPSLKGGNSVKVLMSHYGFITKSAYDAIPNCVKKIYYSSPLENERAENTSIIFEALKLFAEEAKDTAKDVIEDSRLTWSEKGKYFSNKLLPADSTSSNCEIVRSDGYRTDGKWFTTASITDQPMIDTYEGARLTYVQHLYLDKERNLQSINLNITQCVGELKTSSLPGTAYISRWKGSSYSSFIGISPKENPALIAARNEWENLENDFEDLDSPPDIAIFVLPLALALIPVGLFTDVSQWSSLLLVLIADIFNAVPIGLKSAYLFLRASNSKYVMESNLYGFESGDELNGAAEIWIAKCNIRSSVRTTGAILLAIMIISIIISILMDIIVMRMLVRVKKDYLKAILEHGISLYDSPSAGLLWYLSKKNWPNSLP